MRYPTIAQYIESISNPDGLFETLCDVQLMRWYDNEPIYTVGGFGVVFKVNIGGRPFAMKCFTRHQPGRIAAYERIVQTIREEVPNEHLADLDILDGEITVFDEADTPHKYPVVMMEWIDGEPLTVAIDRAARSHDVGRLEQLADGFDRMALWLLCRPFAHGDIKPDNIIVRPDGASLVLIDYDGIYTQGMKGECARETGTDGFRHPRRNETSYGKYIDDYPIALLSLSLRAIASDVTLYDKFHVPDRLLFDPQAIIEQRCLAYNYLQNSDIARDRLYGMLSSDDERLDDLEQALEAHLCICEPMEFDFIGDPFQDIRLYRRGGKYGFVTSQGRAVTGAVFDRARNFSDGAAAVSVDGKWGYIDPRGELLQGYLYDDCGDFAEGFAAVKVGDKWGYLNQSFEIVIGCRFRDCWPFAQGRAMVKVGERYGFVNASNRMAISARYDFAQSFREGVACVAVGGLYGFINRSGRYLIEPTFDYARSKRDGRVYGELRGIGHEIEI